VPDFSLTGDLDLGLEIAWGADLTAAPDTWAFTDHSDRLLQSSLTIVHGLVVGTGNETRGSVSGLQLLNDDGELTPFRAASSLYPNVDNGAPARLWLRTNTTPYATDLYARTVTNAWGTPTTGPAWTGVGTSYNVGSGVGTIGLTAANTVTNTRLAIVNRDVRFQWDTSIAAVSTGAPTVCGSILRSDSGLTHYVWAGLQFSVGGGISWNVRQVAGSVETSAVVTAQPGLTYSAATLIRCEVELVGDRLRARAWLTAGTKPLGWAVDTTVADADNLVAAPYLGFRTWLQSGATNTLPNPVSVDNVTIEQPKYARFEGYVADIQPVFRPLSDGTTHSVAQIKLAGVGSRLEKLTASALSPLRRSLEKSATPPIAYWPCEDKSGATLAASAYDDQPGMVVTGPAVFSFDIGLTDDLLIPAYGTTALVSLAAGARLSAPVPLTTATAWTVSMEHQSHTATSGLTTIRLLEWPTGGTFQRWALIGTATGHVVRAYNDTAGSTTDVITYPNVIATELANWSVTATQNAGNIDVQLYVNASLQASGSVAGTIGAPGRVTCNPDQANTTASTNPYGIRLLYGHVTVHDSVVVVLPFYFDGPQLTRADRAWAYETAHKRGNRVAGEDHIPFTVLGDPDTTGPTLLNAQREATTPDLMRQAVESESGALLLEARFGWLMDPRSNRYGRAAQVVVDMTTYRVTDGTEPTAVLVPRLDPRGANQWTVARHLGSEATFAADKAYRDRRGTIADKAELDVLLDTDCPPHAQWRTHLSVDGAGANYPTMGLDLLANPGLVDDWLLCRIGSRVRWDNQPTVAGVGSVDQILDGITETIVPREAGGPAWSAALNCSPAQVWDVSVWDEAMFDSGSTALANDMAAGDTWAYLVTSNGEYWSDTDPPYDLAVSGQTNRVLGMSRPDVVQTADGSMETGDPSDSGWYLNPDGSASTLTGSTATVPYGTYAALLTTVGTPGFLRVRNAYNATVVAGGSYRVWAWAYSPAGGNVDLETDWLDSGFGYLSSSTSTVAVPAATWVQIFATFTAPALAENGYHGLALTGSPTAGTLLYFKAVDFVRLDVKNGRQVALWQRGINNVPKALTAGASVSLADTDVLGL